MNLPIGSVVGLHKDIVTPAISVPNGWVGCDGQVLNDVDSLLHGLAMPDLNGDKRFIRGGADSGVEQDDKVKNHAHNVALGSHRHSTPVRSVTGGSHAFVGSTGDNVGATCYSAYTNLGTKASGNPTAGGNVESRPINMSLYFIIKVKEVPVGEDWHEVGADGEPDFEENWKTAPGSKLEFRKVDKNVEFRGGAIPITGTAMTIFTLPVDYRPSASQLVTAYDETAEVAEVADIEPDGQVIMLSGIDNKYDHVMVVGAVAHL